jgi:mRNA interferase HicA
LGALAAAAAIDRQCAITYGNLLGWVGGALASLRNKNINVVVFKQKNNIYVIFLCMNSKQMKKWLEQQGASFVQGKGSHLNVFLNGKKSVLPMHGTQELGKGLESAIKRQLGLK